MNHPEEKPDDTMVFDESGQIEPGQDEPPLKDRQFLKDSLSQEEIIDYFYNCIGQKKISKKKREKAISCLEGLLDENYSLEDMKFTIDWTVKNAEKKLYDFSIIEHTISQAMSDKEEIDKKEAARLDQKRIDREKQAEQEQIAENNEKIEKYKKTLSPKERKILRHRALEEIKNMEGVKEEFVTEHLISAQESEILKSEIQ